MYSGVIKKEITRRHKRAFMRVSRSLFAVLIVVFAVFIFVGVMVPDSVYAQTGPSRIVPDCGANCTWAHLVTLAKNILNFLIYISVPIAAIAFAYAGFLYLSARGNPGQISKAHGIFMNVAIGLIIVLVAWAVVDFILDALIEEESYVPVLTETP